MLIGLKIISFLLLLIFGLSDLISDEKVRGYEKYWLDKATSLIRYIKRYWKILFYLSFYSLFYFFGSVLCLITFTLTFKYSMLIFAFPWTVWLPSLIVFIVSLSILLACLLLKFFDHLDKKKEAPPKLQTVWKKASDKDHYGYTYDLISLFFGRICNLYEEVKQDNVKIPIDIKAFYGLIIKFGYTEYIGWAGLGVVYGFFYLINIITNYLYNKFGSNESSWLNGLIAISMVLSLFLFVGFGIAALVLSLPVVLIAFVLYFPIMGVLLLITSGIRLVLFVMTSILWLFLFYPALLLKKISYITGQASIFKIGKYIVWAGTTTFLLVMGK